MKKKLFTLLITGLMISAGASSQTIRDNINKAKNDKDAQERSAKADVLIHKRVISDSSTTTITPVKTVSRTPGVSKVKQKKNKHKLKLRKPLK